MCFLILKLELNECPTQSTFMLRVCELQLLHLKQKQVLLSIKNEKEFRDNY